MRINDAERFHEISRKHQVSKQHYTLLTHIFSSKKYDLNFDYYKISDDPYMFSAKYFQVLCTYKFSTFVSIGINAILIHLPL